jgi:transposase
VLRHHFNWTRLSMAGALAYKPGGSEAALMFQIKEGSYSTASLIGFLHDLHGHFAGAQVTLIWDGLPSHRSTAMKNWITTQHGWLAVERLPGYAHDLNPIELVWGSVKAVELASLCPDTIDEARDAAETGLKRVSSSSGLSAHPYAEASISIRDQQCSETRG